MRRKKEPTVSMEQVAENQLIFNEIGGIRLTYDAENAVTGDDFNAGGPRRRTYPGNIPVKRGRPPKRKN